MNENAKAIDALEEMMGEEGLDALEDQREEETEEPESEGEEEPESEGEEDPEEEVVETVELDAAVIAQALGIEEGDVFVDDDGKIGIRAKVNGEEVRASLGDLKKSYQLQKNLDDKAHALNQERDQFRSWVQEQAQVFQTEAKVADGIIESQMERLAEQYKAVDWERLRASDPAEWSARRQEFSSAYNTLKGQKEVVLAKVQEQQHELVKRQQAEYQQMLAKEVQALAEKLPEWQDNDVATRERGQLADYLRGLGYGDHELNIADHRAILLARKAMLYDKQAKAQPEAKKVRKVARVMQSGSQQTSGQKAKKQSRERFDRLKRTGSESDAVEALLDIL